LDDTVEEILQLNHLRDDAMLLPGQLIQLPGR
jgi:LysM repeat protein